MHEFIISCVKSYLYAIQMKNTEHYLHNLLYQYKYFLYDIPVKLGNYMHKKDKNTH